MPIADPNEVHAYLRACQDPNELQQLHDLCDERVRFITTPQNVQALTLEQGKYTQETNHTSGWNPAPLTGPSPAPVLGNTTMEQAMINDVTLKQQKEQGRLQYDKPEAVVVNADQGSGELHVAREAIRAEEVQARTESGEEPLVAESKTRGTLAEGLEGSHQQAVEQSAQYAAMQKQVEESGNEGTRKAAQEQVERAQQGPTTETLTTPTREQKGQESQPKERQQEATPKERGGQTEEMKKPKK
jgi:hypothetical protein